MFNKNTAALAVAAASLVPAMHIAREVRLHHLALDHLWQLLDETGSYLTDQKLLIVNPVGWIAPIVPTYALGHEGVEVMPGYVTPQLLIWAHTQRLYDIEAVTFPLVFPRLKGIYFGTWGEALDWEAMAQRARSVDRVALVDYADDRVEFHYVGSVLSSRPETPARFDARFDGRILLSSVAPAHLNRGAIELELEWSPNAASDEDIFANAFACGGQVLGLSGGAGLGGVYPVWLWQPGERIREVRRIRLDSPSPDGCYRIEMGLFDPQRGERTPAYGQDGARLANDIVPLEFKGR